LALVRVAPDAGLTVTTEDMQLVTISTEQALPPDGASIGYTVANGSGSATGVVRVVPVPAQDPLPPQAHDIDATVRAGDAVTIPISRHASDPNGDMITITGMNTDTVAADSGVLFHTDSAIRYLAADPGPRKPIRFS